MNRANLLHSIENLNIWKKHDQRAPHKPLLILYALGQLQSGKKKWLSYSEASSDLKKLLIDFGPYRKSYHPEQPFIRLKKDGIWQLNLSEEGITNLAIRDNHLKSVDVKAGFKDDVILLLEKDKTLLRDIAEMLLESHFPPSLHEDILCAVGLDIHYGIRKVRKRDTQFREKILRAYGYRCAVCGFDVKLGHKIVAIEAAHIKWHQAGGPDLENNGVALCSMHHKLFDLGVFTINTDHKIIVSQSAHGSQGLNEWLLKYHSQKLAHPIELSYLPEKEFLNWNVREVFKGDGRYL